MEDEVKKLQKYYTSNQQTEKVLSLKFRAINLYMQRILRPIWDLNLTNMPRIGEMTYQSSNVMMMEGALKKLQNLQLFLEAEKSNLADID